MELNFGKTEGINLDNVGYGDVLVMSDGSKWLITRDSDGWDYRGVNLETDELTDYAGSIENLVKYELCETVERLIKSDDLVLGIK